MQLAKIHHCDCCYHIILHILFCAAMTGGGGVNQHIIILFILFQITITCDFI